MTFHDAMDSPAMVIIFRRGEIGGAEGCAIGAAFAVEFGVPLPWRDTPTIREAIDDPGQFPASH